MKLRAVFNRQREVLELLGDAITLNDCREAVCRRFNLRRNNFNLSLNGQDILDNDSVPLKDLGIVNGDLIYVITARDSEQHGDNPGNQYADFLADQHPFQHSPERGESLQCNSGASTSIQHDVPQTSTASVTSLRSHVLLCREGIPQALEDLYRAAEVGTIHEASWIVIHFLMLETGYICASENLKESSEADRSQRIVLPVDWKKGGTARIKYTHASCPGLTSSLTCTSLGPYVMVHGIVDSVSGSEIYQCRLQPTDFVRGNVDLKTSGASTVYYNLHRLSRLIKDQVAYPLLAFMRSALGLPQLCGLMALPAEVKLMVLGRLPVPSILNVASTCQEMRSLSNDPSLWQHLVFRDFGRKTKDQAKSWKMEYISLYRAKRAHEKMRLQLLVPPPALYPPGHGIETQPFRGDTFPPGIIGGHSDLYPNLPFMPGGINPMPGAAPAPGMLRPRFDPFGPLPDMNQMPGPSRRGRRSGRHPNFPPSFF